MKRIWWSVLLERNPPGVCISTVIDLAMHAGRYGFTRLVTPYARTDFVRNALADQFMRISSEPDDTLIMLDDDHAHMPDTLERLVEDDLPIVGALAFRRGEPYDPCAFIRTPDGKLQQPDKWPAGEIFACDIIGHAAIAIQRRVFLDLESHGSLRPWWRYEYTDGSPSLPSEDMYFGRICEGAGIKQYVDTSIIPPHLTNGWIDADSHSAWVRDHPAAEAQ